MVTYLFFSFAFQILSFGARIAMGGIAAIHLLEVTARGRRPIDCLTKQQFLCFRQIGHFSPWWSTFVFTWMNGGCGLTNHGTVSGSHLSHRCEMQQNFPKKKTKTTSSIKFVKAVHEKWHYFSVSNKGGIDVVTWWGDDWFFVGCVFYSMYCQKRHLSSRSWVKAIMQPASAAIVSPPLALLLKLSTLSCSHTPVDRAHFDLPISKFMDKYLACEMWNIIIDGIMKWLELPSRYSTPGSILSILVVWKTHLEAFVCM